MGRAVFVVHGFAVRFREIDDNFANPHRGILRLLRKRGGWIDAVSPCEVETALKAGFPADRVLFTGTSVSFRQPRPQPVLQSGSKKRGRCISRSERPASTGPCVCGS